MIQVVIACQVNGGSRNLKRKFLERDLLVFSIRNSPLMFETTSSISSLDGCPCARRLSLSILILNLRFQELAIGDLKLSLEPQLLADLSG